MMKIQNVAIAAMVSLGFLLLGGCQTSQTGISTHLGTQSTKSLKKNQIKISKRVSRKSVSPQPKSVREDVVNIVSSAKSPVAPAKLTQSKLKKRKISKKSKRSSKKYSRLRSNKRSVKGDRLRRKKSAFDKLIRHHARVNGVPYALARAVVQVESGFNVGARGGVGEIGLMQLRKSTARGMGYRGSTRGLYNPETNIKYGMRYLGKAYKLGGRSTCGAILKYNAGHGARRMNPISRRYCGKVRKIMRGRV